MLGVLRYIHNNPVKAKMTGDILKYRWSSVNDYINKKSDIISNKYLHKILNLFKDNKEFINFHSINDDNIYIDTKEEEFENIQSIINKTMENYINENCIIDQKQVTIEQKEELANKLLNLKVITHRDIAELCNLTVYRVSEINKKIKEV